LKASAEHCTVQYSTVHYCPAAAPEALDPFKADTPLTLVPLRDAVTGALEDTIGSKKGEGPRSSEENRENRAGST
jgi:hypothetical protein